MEMSSSLPMMLFRTRRENIAATLRREMPSAVKGSFAVRFRAVRKPLADAERLALCCVFSVCRAMVSATVKRPCAVKEVVLHAFGQSKCLAFLGQFADKDALLDRRECVQEVQGVACILITVETYGGHRRVEIVCAVKRPCAAEYRRRR